MLVHRLRRWSNIDPTLGQCLVLAGLFKLAIHVAVMSTGERE